MPRSSRRWPSTNWPNPSRTVTPACKPWNCEQVLPRPRPKPRGSGPIQLSELEASASPPEARWLLKKGISPLESPRRYPSLAKNQQPEPSLKPRPRPPRKWPRLESPCSSETSWNDSCKWPYSSAASSWLKPIKFGCAESSTPWRHATHPVGSPPRCSSKSATNCPKLRRGSGCCASILRMPRRASIVSWATPSTAPSGRGNYPPKHHPLPINTIGRAMLLPQNPSCGWLES